MTPDPQQFASDNYAGICPEAWAAMAEANHGHARAYGDDPWTQRAADAFRELFEKADAEVFFAFNGTAANSLALASLCQSYHSVICSHVGACRDRRMRRAGIFLQRLEASDRRERGRQADAGAGARACHQPVRHSFPEAARGDDHAADRNRTGVQLDEIRALSATCRELGLRLHMDGARFANACATLGCSPAEMTWKAGVDLLCFGGTKNGMAVGEAILFFDPRLGRGFRLSLQAGGATGFEDALPRRALGRPAAGRRVAEQRAACQCLRGAPGGGRSPTSPDFKLMFPVEANAVFLRASADRLEALRDRGWQFYTFIGGGARFMFAWDSDPARVDALARDIREVSAVKR